MIFFAGVWVGGWLVSVVFLWHINRRAWPGIGWLVVQTILFIAAWPVAIAMFKCEHSPAEGGK